MLSRRVLVKNNHLNTCLLLPTRVTLQLSVQLLLRVEHTGDLLRVCCDREVLYILLF